MPAPYRWGDAPMESSLANESFQAAVHRLYENGGKMHTALATSASEVDPAAVAPDGWYLVASFKPLRYPGRRCAHFQRGGGREHAYTYASGSEYDDAQVTVVSADPEAAERLASEWIERCPPAVATDAAHLRFVTRQVGGFQSRERVLEAPSWAEIRSNYNRHAEAALGALAAWDGPPEGGRLLLLHGAPGTGKTTAIRAILREWAHWCQAVYIVDSETFFADSGYMLNVLLDTRYDPGFAQLVDDDDEPPEPERWRLIIVEDADDLISSTANTTAGFGRLLNVCDGMVGQGVKVMLLLTTNEPLTRLHPAVMRPGRCAANIEVGALDRADANRWRESRGLPEGGGATLAELFEELRGCGGQVSASAEPMERGGYA